MKKKNDGAATAPNPQQRRRMPKLVEMKALPMEQLSPHPDAEAFGAEEEDRQALRGSVAECGLLDPISVAPADDAAGGWLVIDGCGRLDAARARGYAYVPCMVFDLGDFSVREFALHRNTMQRKVTTGQRVLCYLQTNGQETGGMSRDTRREIAKTLGCSDHDVAAARELMEEVEKDHAAAEEEALHEVFDDVLAGRTPIRRWKAALAGRTATKDKPKKAIDYAAVCARVCASLDTLFKAWPSLRGQLKGEIEDALYGALERAPFALPQPAGSGDDE